MKRLKNKKITRKRILTVTAVVLCILISLSIGAYMNYKIVLKEYFEASEAAYKIPDISKGFIPQGITYDETSGYFFLTGYMGNSKVSPIYVINNETDETERKILMRTHEGKNFRGHAGGISVYDSKLYIAGSTDACMYSFPIADILNTPDGGYLNADRRIELKTDNDHIRVSFTSFEQDLLYAGEFHNDPIFQTDKSHNIDTSDGVQKGLLFGFEVNENGEALPVKAYSIPDNIQGACFYDHYVFLSCSDGLFPSKIYTFDLNQIPESGTHTFLEKDIPLYLLNPSAAVKETKIPPMSEEIIVVDGKMYILYESASNRYIIGKWMDLDYVYATPMEYFIQP